MVTRDEGGGRGKWMKAVKRQGKKGNRGLNYSLKNRPGLNVFFSAMSTRWQRMLGVVWKKEVGKKTVSMLSPTGWKR